MDAQAHSSGGRSFNGRESSEAVDDLVRAQVYGLLGRLLARPPDAGLLARLAELRSDAVTPVGRAFGELAQAAAGTSAAAAEREHNALFIGVDRGELVPYASFYLTGFLLDRPLARLRRDMARLGIERAPGVAEPEDHVATMCEIMAGLLDGSLGSMPAGGNAADPAGFFERNLAPWAGRFFADLERAHAARLYRPVGTIGRLLVALETALTQQDQGQGQGQ